ncbi:MAG: metallophosphatase [Niabella sp.]
MEELLSSKISRRYFLRTGSVSAALLAAGLLPRDAFASGEVARLTILHTNDVHSRIEPFPMDGSRFQGQGGVAARAALINKIRTERSNVLLLDAGDIFQGTPYFNKFGGEPEIKLMSKMGYDAGTIGNHDFDNGLTGFLKYLPEASFPFICSNYDFSDTMLQHKTVPYKTWNKQGVKVGILGVGIELEGLVKKENYGNTRYLDPVTTANKIAALLKKELRCDLVICLSHLGYQYNDKKISDVVLAAQSRNIDLIIGGHTHTFLKEPITVRNLDGVPLTINQVGWAGICLGQLDYFFEKRSRKRIMNYQLHTIKKPLS